MAIRDKIASFLGQLGAQVGPTLEQIGSTAGTVVAGVPGKAQMELGPFDRYYRKIIPPTYGLLGAVGLPQVAQNVQVQMLNPQVAQNVGAGLLGAGALGLGEVTAGTAAAILANKKKRKAGQYLAAQHGLTMDEDVPIVY
jgi:hypothetical protein